MISVDLIPQSPMFMGTPQLNRNDQNTTNSEMDIIHNIRSIDGHQVNLSPIHPSVSQSTLADFQISLMGDSDYIEETLMNLDNVGMVQQDHIDPLPLPEVEVVPPPAKRQKTADTSQLKQSQRWNSQTLKSPAKLLQYALNPSTSPEEIRACMQKLLDIEQEKKKHELNAKCDVIDRLSAKVKGIITSKSHFLDMKAGNTATVRDVLVAFRKADLSKKGRREINKLLNKFQNFPPLTEVEAEEKRLKARFRDYLKPESFGPDMLDGVRVKVDAALELAIEIIATYK
jgi:uncharacterized protein YktA (UPF0223 family)